MIKILMAALITFSATDGFTGRDRVTHKRGHLHKGGRYSKRHTAYPYRPNTDFSLSPSKTVDSQRKSTPHHRIQQPSQTPTPSVTTATEEVAAAPVRVKAPQPPKAFDRARKKKTWDTERRKARDDKYARQHEDDFETDRSILITSIINEIKSLENRTKELEVESNALEKRAANKKAQDIARVEEIQSTNAYIEKQTKERSDTSAQRDWVGARLRRETEDSNNFSETSLTAQTQELNARLLMIDHAIIAARARLNALKNHPTEEAAPHSSGSYESDIDEYSSPDLRDLEAQVESVDDEIAALYDQLKALYAQRDDL